MVSNATILRIILFAFTINPASMYTLGATLGTTRPPQRRQLQFNFQGITYVILESSCLESFHPWCPFCSCEGGRPVRNESSLPRIMHKDSCLAESPYVVPPQTSVEGSIVQMDARTQQEPAISVMPASHASNKGMGKKTALSRCEVTYGMCPKYLWYNVWEAWGGEKGDTHFESLQCLADWTKQAKPLPSVPITELHNATTMHMIRSCPDLFKIITPINVDHFEALLVLHPNRPFIESVCRGLREGFWPWADTHQGEYPSTVDEVLDTPEDGPEADFLRTQWDHEQQAGRFSGPFG